VGRARLRHILDWLGSNRLTLSDFLHDAHLQRVVLKEKEIDALQSNLEAARNTWKDLQEQDVHILKATDSEYPALLRDRLGDKTPPVLFVRGNRRVMDRQSVGFCGSRKASEKGLRVAEDTAGQLAERGTNIVSGYAAGVDLAVHEAALAHGGRTTLVLAEGILRFRIKRALKELWDWERVAVVSEFLPGLPWTVHNAMQRNTVICSMSSAMVLIEAKNSGGSLAAGKTCLALGVPLFAAVYEGMPESAEGNLQLIDHGARTLMRSRKTGRANIRRLLTTIEKQESGRRFVRNPTHSRDTSPQLGVFEQG